MQNIIKEKIHQIHTKYGKKINLDIIFKIFKDIQFVRYPVEFIYKDCFMNNNQLGLSKPNKKRNWTSYAVYLRPFLKKDEKGKLLVLAHELAHIIFGQYIDENGSNCFAGLLLGIEKQIYLEKLKFYKPLLSKHLYNK